jgi:hypothetical protein
LKNNKQYSVEISTIPIGEILLKLSVEADTPIAVGAAYEVAMTIGLNPRENLKLGMILISNDVEGVETQ